MPRYLISYDLDKPGPQNYDRLGDRLRELQAVHVLYSQWFLMHPLRAQELEADFMQYIDPSTDSFLIVEIGSRNSAWNKLRIPDDQFGTLLGDFD